MPPADKLNTGKRTMARRFYTRAMTCVLTIGLAPLSSTVSAEESGSKLPGVRLVEYRDTMTTMCDDIAAEAAEERQLTGKRVMGIKRIIRFSSMHIPEGDNRSPAPFVHCLAANVAQQTLR